MATWKSYKSGTRKGCAKVKFCMEMKEVDSISTKFYSCVYPAADWLYAIFLTFSHKPHRNRTSHRNWML